MIDTIPWRQVAPVLLVVFVVLALVVPLMRWKDRPAKPDRPRPPRATVGERAAAVAVVFGAVFALVVVLSLTVDASTVAKTGKWLTYPAGGLCVLAWLRPAMFLSPLRSFLRRSR